MTYNHMAIEILRDTSDGDKLGPSDLKLLELAVNGFLNEAGEVAFYDLHRRVMAGEYRKPWLHGVENLTRDHEGYVYWRDARVEHYSYYNEESYIRLQEEAERLGAACRAIEARGETVTGFGSVCKEMDAMEAGAAT